MNTTKNRIAAILASLAMVIGTLCASAFTILPVNAEEADTATADMLTVQAPDGIRTVNATEDSYYVHLDLQEGDIVQVEGGTVTIASENGIPLFTLTTQLPEGKKINYDPLNQDLSITNTRSRSRRCTNNKVAIWTAKAFGGLAVCAPLTAGTGGNAFVGAGCIAGVDALVSAMTC